MQILRLEDKIRACWLGKNIGGTLGGPFEGRDTTLNLSFYEPVPTRVLANDDLDLQVVWLHHLRSTKAKTITPDIMADAWRRHVHFPFDEYGITHRNDRLGVKGATRGSFDNYFGECMGGAIRSEVWACIAAGEPRRAAAFAQVDAAVDHCGEGILAEVFHAALQAMAFVETDKDRLIDASLQLLPPDSALVEAIGATRAWWHASGDWTKVREQIVQRYGTGNFTHVVCNLCFEVLGWYAGAGDFGRSICIAVNCGLDTDCTGATLGALLGIIDPDSIPGLWSAPVGEDIVLSPAIHDVPVPRNLNELTRWTLELRQQFVGVTPEVPAAVPLRPQETANPFIRLPGEVASSPDAALLDAATAPALTTWQQTVLHGYWQRLLPVRGDAVQLFRFSVQVPGTAPIKLLAFGNRSVTAWVNGRVAVKTTPELLRRDPFLAPSFHRAGVSAAVVTPEGGRIELVIACGLPPAGELVRGDLVFGFADPETNLWRTDVIFGPVPASALR